MVWEVIAASALVILLVWMWVFFTMVLSGTQLAHWLLVGVVCKRNA